MVSTSPLVVVLYGIDIDTVPGILYVSTILRFCIRKTTVHHTVTLTLTYDYHQKMTITR